MAHRKRGGIIFILLVFLFSAIASFGLAPVVTFSPERGFYNQSFMLTLSCANPSAIIRYTTDCSLPTRQTGIVYTGQIVINATTVVKAVAFSATDSSVLETHTYLFPESIKNQGKLPAGYPTTWGGFSTIAADYEMDSAIINHPAYKDKINAAITSLPALVLTMPVDEWFNPVTGLYVGYPNTTETREKPVSAEMIYSDGTKNFGLNCGVQNQGGTSIVNWKVPKQSMRLLFKEQYGPKKLEKKLFPDSEIKSINTLVVDGFLYSWVHISDRKQWETTLFFRDQLCSDMQNAMGGPSFHGIYVNLFINGLYWGLYDLHERPDEDFMAEYYDAETTDFDVIKHNYKTIVAGSNASYLALLDKARAGLSTNASLEAIKKDLDLPAFIDYMLLNFYLGNYDWAHQNYYAAVNKTRGSGYRFYTWDAEHVLRYSDVSYDATIKSDKGGPTEIHTLLKQNDWYRLLFADAFYRYAYNDGALCPENFEKLFLVRKEEIELATILESARWGDYRKALSGVTYTRDDYWLPEVNKVLNKYIPQRREVVLGQLQRSDNRLYPVTPPPVLSRQEGLTESGTKVGLANPDGSLAGIVYTTNGTDPRASDGSFAGNLYSEPVAISSATLLKARTRNTNTGEWSPLVTAFFAPPGAQEKIVISEIMYNSGYNDLEFIKLTNAGTTDLNLFGLSFSDAIEFSFSTHLVLEPGKSLVLTNEPTDFEALYGFKAYGVYFKNLSNKGETIVLNDYFGATIDSVSYSDSSPWPAQADGKGRSLELISCSLDNSLALSWKASDKLYGTPEPYIVTHASQSDQLAVPVRLWPNPAREMVFMDLRNGNPAGEAVVVRFFDYAGRLVKVVDQVDSGSVIRVNLNGLDAGSYLVRISPKKCTNAPITFKLICLGSE